MQAAYHTHRDPPLAGLGRCGLSVRRYTGCVPIVNDTLGRGYLLPGSASAPSVVQRPNPTWVPANFQSGHGWTQAGTGTNSDDTADFILGSQSFKTVTNGGGAQSKMRKTALTARDCTGKALRIKFKITGLDKCTTVLLYVGDGTFTNFWTTPLRSTRLYASVQPDDLSANVRDDEWVTMTIPFAAMAVGGGSPTKTAITDYQLLVQDNSLGTVTFRVNEIAIVPATNSVAGLSANGGMVTFWFDDGWSSQYTVAKPYLDKYGFAATLPVITDKIGTDSAFCTLVQLQALELYSGWEIACHAFTNDHHGTLPYAMASLPLTECASDWDDQRNWLLDVGLGRGRDVYAYPNGKFTAAMEAELHQHFAVARTIDSTFWPACPPSAPERLPSTGYAYNTTTLAALKALVDSCVARGGWLNFTFHKLVASPVLSFEYLISDFQALVDYVAASGLPVMTASQAMQATGRIV